MAEWLCCLSRRVLFICNEPRKRGTVFCAGTLYSQVKLCSLSQRIRRLKENISFANSFRVTTPKTSISRGLEPHVSRDLTKLTVAFISHSLFLNRPWHCHTASWSKPIIWHLARRSKPLPKLQNACHAPSCSKSVTPPESCLPRARGLWNGWRLSECVRISSVCAFIICLHAAIEVEVQRLQAIKKGSCSTVRTGFAGGLRQGIDVDERTRHFFVSG
jgi:hypothetical protein